MSNELTTPTGDNNAPQAASTVFKAKIIDQMVAVTTEGDTRVILTVRVHAQLKDAQDLASGAEPCPAKEHDVWLNIPSDDEPRLRMALRDLERLDFNDDDVSRLHPEHAETVSLVGKEVHVRCKVSGDYAYWNLVWPREKPKAVSVAEFQQKTSKLTDAIRNVREQGSGKKGARSKPTQASK